MSVELVWAVALFGAALGLMLVVVRRDRLTYIGVMFLMAMAVFHVVGEIVSRINPERNRYRIAFDQTLADNFVWVAGPSVLAFAVIYCLVLGRYRISDQVVGRASDMEFFDWRSCLLATAPLYVLAVAGIGFVPGSQVNGAGGDYFSSGVTSQFLLVGVTLTTVALIIRFGHSLAFVTGEAIALLLLGQRSAVAAGLVVTAALLARYGMRLRSKNVWAVAAVAAIGALTISSARVEIGRTGFNAGAGAVDRYSAIVEGLGGLGAEKTREQLADDYVYRIDGNYFGSLVLQAQNNGDRPVGVATLGDSIRLAVPSAISPGKLEADITALSDKAYIAAVYNLDRRIDYLPTHLGTWLAWGGAWRLPLISGLMGGAFALLDRWLRKVSPARTTIFLGMMIVIVYYEQGPRSIFVTLRGALILAVFFTVSKAVLRRRPVAQTIAPAPSRRVGAV